MVLNRVLDFKRVFYNYILWNFYFLICGLFFLNDRYLVFRMYWMILKKKLLCDMIGLKFVKKRKIIVEGVVVEFGFSLFLWFI